MAAPGHAGLDEVIHAPARLGIMAFLVTAGRARFGELKARLDLTDGNLATHLRKLESAGYVEVEKRFAGRKPQTTIWLTPAGRDAFADYVGRLESLLSGGTPATVRGD